jgi:hypothetical protein
MIEEIDVKDLIKEVNLTHRDPYRTCTKRDKSGWHRQARRILNRLLRREVEEEERHRCLKCNVVQDATEFSPDPTRFGWCNTCHARWIEERYI